MTPSNILSLSASLLNDQSMAVFTNAVQIPYLNMAISELREYFELNNVPSTNETSAVIQVNAGVTTIGFTTVPALPSDLVEIQRLWVSSRDQNSWVPVTRKEFLTQSEFDSPVSIPTHWSWINQEVRLVKSNQNNDIKLDYIKSIFLTVTTGNLNVDLGIINADTFLIYRTAGLVSRFIGENPTRADELDRTAEIAKDRLVGISTKSRQSIVTRRRPFRHSFRSRGLW